MKRSVGARRSISLQRGLLVLTAALSLSQFACVDQILNKIFPAKKSPVIEVAEPIRATDELLGEMFTVVYFSAPQESDVQEFTGLSQSLKQGASLEGVYRGLVASNRYRSLESQSGAATPALLKAFAVSLAEVREGMVTLRNFSAQDAVQVPSVSYPDESDSGVEVKTFPLLKPAADKRLGIEEDAANLAKTFVGASLFTLKRVLCEAALSRLDELGGSHDEVAQWYSKFAASMAQSKIDFGLKQRNLGDGDLHFSWAMKASDDRIKWETLNRYHRYLNAISVQR